ncbi:MAG: hypothetical protein ACREBJ_03460 [Nitrosotalea sp.]
MGFLDLETKTDNSYLRPTVTSNYTEIDLIITYSDLLKLYIFHKTNKILTNSNQGLTKYLSSHKLFLSSACDGCLTRIDSQYLEFNVDKGYMAATGINTEMLIVEDKTNRYHINSFFMADKSVLTVDRIDKATPVYPLQIELPLLPKYRFKNKEHFLNKMKTYITFS